jgi:citrate lyase subunit beta/citryl-CoA lyase
MRSLLFVPGDDARKLEKAAASGADALILDLEDSVSHARKSVARDLTRAFLDAHRHDDGPRLFVRINGFDTGLAERDVTAVVGAAPAALVLPKAAGGADIQALAARIAVAEADHDLPDGSIGILAIATETAAALFSMGSYIGCSRRLLGLAWGGEDLAADLGAETNRDARGDYTDAYRLARALTLIGASAARVAAIDSVYVNFRDDDGLKAEAEAARRDGFAGKMAIHPAQVPVINQVFTPSAEAVGRARRILDAFAASPGAGVINLDGHMVDRPHLRQAERTLQRARAAGID